MATLSPRRRWAAYGVAAALTAAAMVAVDRDVPEEVVQPVPRARTATATATGTATAAGTGTAPASADTMAAAQAPGGLQPPRGRAATPVLADPFGLPTAPADEAAARRAAASAAAATAAAPAAEAPEMPFVYLGRWQEEGRSRLYLQRGDQTFKVAGPGPLDAEYAVAAIEPHRVVLRYLPLNLAQELRLDGPTARPAAATSPTPAPTAAHAAPAAETAKPEEN